MARVGRGWRSIEWTKALVEMGLVVVGILLAFSIDRWWDGVQQRSVERDYLERLREDFTANRVELRRAVAHNDSMVRAGERALRLMSAGNPAAIDDSLPGLLTVVFDAGPVTTHMAPYEELKASGSVRLLRSAPLRARLAEFDALVRGDLATAEVIWREEWVERVRPYLDANTSPEVYSPDLRVGAITVPRSPFPPTANLIARDRTLWNLVFARMQVSDVERGICARGLATADEVLRALHAAS